MTTILMSYDPRNTAHKALNDLITRKARVCGSYSDASKVIFQALATVAPFPANAWARFDQLAKGTTVANAEHLLSKEIMHMHSS
jgi:hypothetical protein